LKQQVVAYWHIDCGSSYIAINAFGAIRRQVMNWSTIEGQWRHYKLRAKMRWSRLSDNELAYINGKRYELSAKIQQAYGIRRADADLQIAHWADEQEVEMQPGRQSEPVQYQAQFQS
jgi:uncharacterized protein YjbJ (UPF0337 family)